MSVETPSAVPASAAGYYFQADRALLYLANATDGATIGVEADDDVACRTHGTTTLEQDKLTFDDGNPFSDFSHNLWNTLAIWLRHWRKSHASPVVVQYRMVTNAVVKDCLARRISTAAEADACHAVIDELKLVARKTTSKTLRPLCNEVLSAGDAFLRDVIVRCELLDAAAGSHDAALDEKIRAALRLPPGLDAAAILQGLKGWIHESLMLQWKQGPAWIRFEEFNKRKYDLIALQHRYRILERPEADIFVSDADRDAARVEQFLAQLTLINADEDWQAHDGDYCESAPVLRPSVTLETS